MTSARTFVVGLDSVDVALVRGWASAGHLPAFQSLIEESIQGEVENPRGLEAGSCWPTFYFGLLPGNTGQFDGARYFDPTRYEHVSYRPASSRRDAIWTTLSRAGKRCGVIDAPYSYPTDDINGIKVVDRGAHVPAGGGDYMNFRTYPKELAAEIEAKFGPDPAGGNSSDFFPVETPGDVKRFRDLYIRRIENKTDLALHYWRTQPFDFFMPVYTEAHCIGHRCWHIHDVSHPNHDPLTRAEVGDPVLDIYIALDRAIGRLINAARADDARVIIYLSHGMGPGYSGTRLLDRVLARLDNRETSTQSGPVMSAVRLLWRNMPDAVRRPLKPLRNQISQDGFQPGRQSRRFFEVFANDRTGGIRINLAGRETNGVVQRGAEYDAVCAGLIADFHDVVNAETGEPIAGEIIRSRDYYCGEYLDLLPDILVTWNRSQPINAVWSPKIGTVDKTGLILPRSGDHTPRGYFFGVADEWPAMHLNFPVKAQDFAPTFAALADVALPATDGEMIAALSPRSGTDQIFQAVVNS